MQEAPQTSQPKRPAWWSRVLLLVLFLIVLWVADSMYRGNRADDELERAGYVERVTMRNLLPKRCGILDYEGVFWGHGPRAAEAQGYVCVGYSHSPYIERVSFDEQLGIDIHG
jgi:hypothetical protein